MKDFDQRVDDAMHAAYMVNGEGIGGRSMAKLVLRSAGLPELLMAEQDVLAYAKRLYDGLQELVDEMQTYEHFGPVEKNAIQRARALLATSEPGVAVSLLDGRAPRFTIEDKSDDGHFVWRVRDRFSGATLCNHAIRRTPDPEGNE